MLQGVFHNHARKSMQVLANCMMWKFRIKLFTMNEIENFQKIDCNDSLRQSELTLVRTNLTRVTSPPNSTIGSSRPIFSVTFSYFLFIFYFPRCTLPDLTSVFFLPFCHHNNKNKRINCALDSHEYEGAQNVGSGAEEELGPREGANGRLVHQGVEGETGHGHQAV